MVVVQDDETSVTIPLLNEFYVDRRILGIDRIVGTPND